MQNNTWVKYSEEYVNDSMEKSFVFNHKSRQGLKNEHFKTKQGSRSEGWGTGSDDKADVRAVSFAVTNQREPS